jgi:hypothetical protein
MAGAGARYLIPAADFPTKAASNDAEIKCHFDA